LEKRQKTIEVIEEIGKRNNFLYENINSLLEICPKNSRNSKEYEDLLKQKKSSDNYLDKFLFYGIKINSNEFEEIKEIKELKDFEKIKENSKLKNEENSQNYENDLKNLENKEIDLEDIKEKNNLIYLDSNTSIEELEKIFFNCKNIFVKTKFFKCVQLLYISKSWSQIIINENKISLNDAETMVKEAYNLSLECEKYDMIKSQISKTKDWIKHSKKISSELKYSELKEFELEGDNLPLRTHELDSLKEFIEVLDEDIKKSYFYIENRKYNFNEFDNFVDRINQYNIIIPEFKILESMKTLANEWRKIAIKILQSRRLCTMYFMPKGETLNKFNNLNNIENIEKFSDCKNEEFLNENSIDEILNNNSENQETNKILNNNLERNDKNKIKKIKKQQLNLYNNNKNTLNNNFEFPIDETLINNKPKRKNFKNKNLLLEESNNKNLTDLSKSILTNEYFEVDFDKISERKDSKISKKYKKRNTSNEYCNNNLDLNENFDNEENINILNNLKIKRKQIYSNDIDIKDNKENKFFNKKLKKAEILQYESLLSAINSLQNNEKDIGFPVNKTNEKFTKRKKSRNNIPDNRSINSMDDNLNINNIDLDLGKKRLHKDSNIFEDVIFILLF
jgi:hypothetical protein